MKTAEEVLYEKMANDPLLLDEIKRAYMTVCHHMCSRGGVKLKITFDTPEIALTVRFIMDRFGFICEYVGIELEKPTVVFDTTTVKQAYPFWNSSLIEKIGEFTFDWGVYKNT